MDPLLTKLADMLNALIHQCPNNVVNATCPRGIEHYPPSQVVFEYNISYARILQAQALLKEVEIIKNVE